MWEKLDIKKGLKVEVPVNLRFSSDLSSSLAPGIREHHEAEAKEILNVLDDIAVFYLSPEVYGDINSDFYKNNRRDFNNLVRSLYEYRWDTSTLMEDIVKQWKTGPLDKYNWWWDYWLKFEQHYWKLIEDMTMEELIDAFKKEAKDPSGLWRSKFNESEVLYWQVKNVIEKYLSK